MKKTILLAFLFLSGLISRAQEADLANDQNPHFNVSREKYLSLQDKASDEMNITIQQTYIAYDWTQAKQEKKQDRINRRQERALARINNRCFMPSPFYYSPFWYYNRY